MRKEQRKMRETADRIAQELEDAALTAKEKAERVLRAAKEAERAGKHVTVRMDDKTVRLIRVEKARKLGIIK